MSDTAADYLPDPNASAETLRVVNAGDSTEREQTILTQGPRSFMGATLAPFGFGERLLWRQLCYETDDYIFTALLLLYLLTELAQEQRTAEINGAVNEEDSWRIAAMRMLERCKNKDKERTACLCKYRAFDKKTRKHALTTINEIMEEEEGTRPAATAEPNQNQTGEISSLGK